jgi:nucleoid-associated protein YgaU
MTSDAKIGLLLGLVFIFIIAFVINGLPGLHHKDDSNKLTTNMVGLQNNPSGLGANERKVALEPTQGGPPAAGYAQPAESAAGSTDARFTMTLPQGAPTAADAAPVSPGVAGPVAALPSGTDTPVASVQPATPNPTPIVEAAKGQPAAPKLYIVQQGDSLSAIAKKVYGEREGNKLTNINALFEANRKTLASVDELQVGQKLIVPPLAGSSAPAPATGSELSGTGFTKVDSIGKRHLSASPDKPTPTAKSDSIYVVREGDSLWQIAAS